MIISLEPEIILLKEEVSELGVKWYIEVDRAVDAVSRTQLYDILDSPAIT
jgi:hypothetical protein